jgi:hypothetical protein
MLNATVYGCGAFGSQMPDIRSASVARSARVQFGIGDQVHKNKES